MQLIYFSWFTGQSQCHVRITLGPRNDGFHLELFIVWQAEVSNVLRIDELPLIGCYFAEVVNRGDLVGWQEDSTVNT